MLQFIDLVGTNSDIYYGLYETETNILSYIQKKELQKKLHNNPTMQIIGLNLESLNSVGYKLEVQPIMCLDIGTYKNIKDFNKIKEYGIMNIPLGFRFVKDNLLYTLQDSFIANKGWHVQIFDGFVSRLKYGRNKIKIEKEFFGFEVNDCSDFFKYVVAGLKRLPTNALCSVEFDLSGSDTSNIIKTDNMFNVELFQDIIDLKGLDFSNVLSCNCMFNQKNISYLIDGIKVSDLQIFDLRGFNAEPLFYSGTDKEEEPIFFNSKYRSHLYIVDNDVFIEDLQKNEEANYMGIFKNEDDLLEIINKVKAKLASFVLLKKPISICSYWCYFGG